MTTSVILLAYNEQENVHNAVTSLLEQSVLPDEIIIVNNMSTDNTLKIAEELATLHNVVKVINQDKHQGMIPTRDMGFDHATGDILIKMDADTVLDNDWIEVLVDVFTNRPDILAMSGRPNFHSFIINPLSTLFYQICFRLITGSPPLYGPAYGIRQNIWKDIKKISSKKDSDVHEDMDITLAIHIQGKVIVNNQLQTHTSGRRAVETPIRFFITDYPVRYFKTIFKYLKLRMQK